MADDVNKQVKDRVLIICPESAKIKDAAVDIFVSDAIFDCKIAFTNQPQDVLVRGASYLASHYCLVNLFQNSQSYGDNNFSSGTSGSTELTPGLEIKTIEYKDKKQEFFEKRKSTNNQSIVKWDSKMDHSNLPLTGTTYGQEFLRILDLYCITETFLVGNDPREPLGRDIPSIPGARYRGW
ncbi:MAG: hypothetical protein ACRC7S_03345 [Cetobacterium sp.]